METPDIESIKWHIVKDLDYLPEVPEEGCKGDLYIVDPRPLGCEIGVFIYNDERLVWECIVKYIWDPETNEVNEVGVQSLTHLIDEICAERECREKVKEIMNSNYGVATRSCDDDEKLVVLCMINKQLKDIYSTLEGMQETLARVDDKI